MSMSFRRLTGDRYAMTAWEYGLIAALVTVAIVSATTSFGMTTSSAFNKLLTQVNWAK